MESKPRTITPRQYIKMSMLVCARRVAPATRTAFDAAMIGVWDCITHPAMVAELDRMDVAPGLLRRLRSEVWNEYQRECYEEKARASWFKLMKGLPK